MWNRAELKLSAKAQLKGRYWNYFGVSLIPSIISSVASIPVMIIFEVLIISGMMKFLTSSGFSEESINRMMERIEDFDFNGAGDILRSSSEFMMLFKAFLPGYIFLFIAQILISVLVIAPLLVGITRWFVRSREAENVRTSICFSPFKRETYSQTVGSMLYYYFRLFIWFLLLYIPGIIKTYAYRMVPYILADNPSIGAGRALKLSNEMTKGHKFRIFILDLSFIGWLLLGYMACGIGILAVIPYINATMAELYDKLKKTAVENGSCTMEELGYTRRITDEETI